MYVQFGVVGVVLLLQVIICVTWSLVEPPSMKRISDRDDFDNQTVVVTCDDGGEEFMWCAFGYICVLAVMAFLLAFRARKLPRDFNEAKFITFAIIFFLLVWGLFIPGYYTTRDTKLAPVVYCIAIYVSSFGFLGCLFAPKVYVIFFNPHHNDTERRRQATFNHAVRATRSVVATSPSLYSDTRVQQKRASWNRNNSSNKSSELSAVNSSSVNQVKSNSFSTTASRLSTETGTIGKCDANHVHEEATAVQLDRFQNADISSISKCDEQLRHRVCEVPSLVVTTSSSTTTESPIERTKKTDQSEERK